MASSARCGIRWVLDLTLLVFAALSLVAPPCCGEELPEIVKIRVPSNAINRVFPAGSELRGLSIEEFRRMETAALDAARRPATSTGPTLIRATHAARWDGQTLSGRSQLLVRGATRENAVVILDPWSPALLGERPADQPLRVGRDGRLGVKIAEPGDQSVALTWEQRARPGSRGRAFDLALPTISTCRLELDLPSKFVPDALGMVRHSPIPGADPGRQIWKFDGPGGVIRVTLRSEEELSHPTNLSWVESRTRIDATASPAIWESEWAFDPGAPATSRLVLDLDRDLELVEVTGDLVASYRTDPPEPGSTETGTRLTIRLEENGSPFSSKVRVRALCRLPLEKPWTLPSATPRDVIWIGGRTIVHIGKDSAVTSVRELSGRQVTPRPNELGPPRAGDGVVLAFEAHEPRPVAELTLANAASDLSVDVRGQLFLTAREAARLEAQVTWKVERGRLLAISVDLPAGWAPQRAQIRAADEVSLWHSDPKPGGGTRIFVRPPLAHDPNLPLTLDVVAVATAGRPFGPMELPRVTSQGARMLDEVWLVRSDPDVVVTPTRARGLAWLDPQKTGLVPSEKLANAPTGQPLLAYRWIAADGMATIERSPVSPDRRPEAWSLARVTSTGLSLDYYVSLRHRDDQGGDVVVGMTQHVDAPLKWTLLEDPAISVASESVSADDQSTLGLPPDGSAFRLKIPKTGRDRVILHARIDRTWSGVEGIPLLVLPPREMARGTLLVSVGRDLRSVISASGLTVQDANWTRRAATLALNLPTEEPNPAGPAPIRSAHAFGYGASARSVRLTTEELAPAATGGVVSEATLKSRSGEDGQAHHELIMRVILGPERAIELELGDGVRIDRTRIDGRPVQPLRVGQSLRFPLPAATTEGQSVELGLEFLGPLRPTLPRCSLPVLSLAWCVELPEPALLRSTDPSLVSTDPGNTREGNRRLWTWTSPDGNSPLSARTQEEIEQQALKLGASGLDLGQWLTKLDSGPIPIVVDRQALAEDDLGPRTRMAPDRESPASSIPRSPLGTFGLRFEAIGRIALVTTQRPRTSFEDGHDLEAWSTAMQAAASQGCDPTDRFQSVARWNGEPSSPYAGERKRGQDDATTGTLSRFRVSGVPPESANVTQAAVSPPILPVCVAILAFWVLRFSPGLGERAGLICVGSSLVLGLGLLVVGPTSWTGTVSGVCWAALAAAASWVGRTWFPRKSRRSALVQRSTVNRRGATSRSESGVIAGLVVVMLWPSGETKARQVEGPVRARLVVALVYDPPFDPQVESSRVIMRLSDFDVLRSMGTPQARPEVEAFLTDAVHEIRRVGTHDVLVASALDLWCDSKDPASWSFPVQGARDLKATLDGREVPVAIEVDGKSGSVAVPGPGRHRLVLQRVGMLERINGVDRLSLAIPPLASARFRAERSPTNDQMDLPTALGRAIESSGLLEVSLGPISSLDVRWTRRNAVGPPLMPSTGSYLALWDIQPAGDRLRLKVTATEPQGLARVGLRLGPGVAVGSVRNPGVAIEISRLAIETGTAWEAQLDPPLPQGESVWIELWSPGSEEKSKRRLPAFEVVSPSDTRAILGIRRPDDWVGRIEPAEADKVVPDDTFAQAWGPFPPGFATLAGAVTYEAGTPIILATGPSRSRSRVRASALLTLSPGRVDVSFTTELVSTGGVARALEVVVPADLRVDRVESPGLTSWSRLSDTRLRLRFDGDLPPPSRTIRISGTVPMDGDPLSPAVHRGAMDVPWIFWPEAQSEPGLLTIASSAGVSFTLDPVAGVVPTSSAAVAGANSVAAFNIPSTARPGTLNWTIEPTGVNVKLQSLVVLHPDSAEWAASAQYMIAWGPCPPVRLRLPTAWADVSRAEIVGSKSRPKIDRGADFTTWTFVPEPAAWGGLQVRISGIRNRPRNGPLAFPNLVPLGSAPVDRVESHLGFADASGAATVVEGSAELQVVDSSRWDEDKLPWPAAGNRNVYRVIAENWSLQFGPPADRGTSASLEGTPRVVMADITCTLGGDGSTIGRAIYHLTERGSAFLPVTMPTSMLPLSASVDGMVVRPRRDAAGQVLIPLPDSGASSVEVVWSEPRDSMKPGASHMIALPKLEIPGVLTLVRVSAPESVRLSARKREIPLSAAELARARRLAQSISDRLATMDRGVKAQLDALLGSCIQFEMAARSVTRATQVGGSSGTIEALTRLRRELAEAISSAGFEDFSRSARARVGSTEADPLPAQVASAPRPDPFRIRPLGPLHAYQTVSDQDLSLTWTEAPRPWISLWAILPSVIIVLGFLVILPFAPGRPRIASAWAVVVSMVAMVIAGGGWLVPLGAILACAIGRIAPGRPFVRASAD